jgi:hypothetical protein
MLAFLMGGIYEVCSWDGLRCHKIHMFHKDWFRHSKVDGEIHIQAGTQHGDLISLLIFL